ncbi:MAG: adenylate/guanylate cyclase domain-containing protein [Rhizobiales bacterium]|nr:adenylate/guanylate cyclase domain-containing protein [Hyphomicrobiales bacterium]
MTPWRTVWTRLEPVLSIGHAPGDDAQLRRFKTIFSATMVAVILYSLFFFVAKGRTLIEHTIDLAAMIGCLASLAVLQVSKSLPGAFKVLMAIALPVLFAYYLVHGNRDGDLYFVILLPIAAITFLGPRKSRLHFTLCLIMIAVVVVVDQMLPRFTHPWSVSPANPEGWVFDAPDKHRFRTLELITYFSTMIILYILSHGGASALREANKRAEVLLLNILPKPIAERLSSTELGQQAETIVDKYDHVSILFADIVGFTELSQKMEPGELVLLLNTLFSEFDRITARHGVEKIKTIGDAYMAVCGLPATDERHAEHIANVALDMVQAVGKMNADNGQTLQLRIGLNSGPVVAGVIGLNKFAYDLWGETVNTASRMESHGRPGLIQVSQATYELLKDKYRFTALGDVEIKGYGVLPAWQLEGQA